MELVSYGEGMLNKLIRCPRGLNKGMILVLVVILCLTSTAQGQGRDRWDIDDPEVDEQDVMDKYAAAKSYDDMFNMKGRFLDTLFGKSFNKRKLHLKPKKCLWQGRPCHPWLTSCCSGMSCVNLVGGYCVPGVELCLCVPSNPYDHFF